jgi:hypothetical protein
MLPALIERLAKDRRRLDLREVQMAGRAQAHLPPVRGAVACELWIDYTYTCASPIWSFRFRRLLTFCARLSGLFELTRGLHRERIQWVKQASHECRSRGVPVWQRPQTPVPSWPPRQ